MMDSPAHEQAGTAQGSGLVSRRPKKWWVGALWALVSPPTACLYVGRPRWAAAGFGGLFVWIIFCLATGFEARILGVAVALGLGLTYVMLPVAFALLAHTQGRAPRHGSFRLYAVSLAAWLMLIVFIRLSWTRTVGLGLYRIAADSMENTLVPGDYLLADLRAYDRRSPARGDVVVHTDPRRRETALIKRIAGLPGDTIQLKYKLLYVNGKLINPPRTQHTWTPNGFFPRSCRLVTITARPLFLRIPTSFWATIATTRSTRVSGALSRAVRSTEGPNWCSFPLWDWLFALTGSGCAWS